MEAVATRTPVRLDLAGGTLDVWPLPYALEAPVVTVNVALDLPCRVWAHRRSDRGFRLRSLDRDEEVELGDREALRAEGGRLALLARAVDAVWDDDLGVDVTVEATSPAGAGLGGSSSLLVALLGALDRLQDRETAPDRLLRLAQEIETAVLRGPTGYQDYHPALRGGCLALEGGLGGVRVERLEVPLEQLARRLRLVFTGAPHVSAVTNGGVLAAWLQGDPGVRDALEGIRRAALTVREALRASDLDRALQAVVAEGALRRRLGPGVDTPATRAVDEAARGAGALGTKILGAGGGGCVLVVLPPDAGASVDRALEEAPGAVLPCDLTTEGLSSGPAEEGPP